MSIANLSWSLYVECPECKQDFDVSDQDSEYVVAKAIFNNKWDDLIGYEVVCPHCQHKFELTGVEY